MKRLVLMISIFFQLAPADAGYASSRWVSGIGAALPQVTAPELAPVVKKLSTLDFKSPYAGDVMNQILPLLASEGCRHYSEFAVLSQKDRAKALSNALAREADIWPREAADLLQKAADPARSPGMTVHVAGEIERALVYGHPFLDDETRKNLAKAYPDIREQADAWRDRVGREGKWTLIRKLIEKYRDVHIAYEGIDATELLYVLDKAAVSERPNSRRSYFNRTARVFEEMHGDDIRERLGNHEMAVRHLQRIGSMAEILQKSPNPETPTGKQTRKFLAEFEPLARLYRSALESADEDMKGWAMSVDVFLKDFQELLY